MIKFTVLPHFNNNPVLFFLLIIFSILLARDLPADQPAVSGERIIWHEMALTFEGPETSEYDKINPFLNYRLDVTFSNGNKEYVVPGFYAADGDAAESGADKGNKWRVNFCPDEAGEWKYKVSFRYGKNIAVSDNPETGEAVYFDGTAGSFHVKPLSQFGSGVKSKGRLRYTGKRYLQYSESKEYFLKGGADSPENFLAYTDFDGTYSLLTGERSGEAHSVKIKNYDAHVKDWKPGDPSWRNDKGKGIIGALNYLASKGMNSVYFLTMNVQGDGNDVWPWINESERTRFDCSKLDQWEIVFSHMDGLGIMLHIVTQETENELLLDIGQTGTLRKLYYRELIARFAHHLAVTWNLGEENGVAEWTPKGQSDDDRKAMAKYIRDNDPYDNFIVVHTHSDEYHRNLYLTPLLGYEYLDGPSLQVHDPAGVHAVTKYWIDKSSKAGRQWVVNLDEIGPADTGAKPDKNDPEHNEIRKDVLWGNLMAGGAGVEWYFGYEYENNDLNCEDWRSRNILWEQTNYALQFFRNYLPYWDMHSSDSLTDNPDDYVFAKEGEIYAIYMPEVVETSLEVPGSKNEYQVYWYNPRGGGELIGRKKATVNQGRLTIPGLPANNHNKDWVLLIK